MTSDYVTVSLDLPFVAYALHGIWHNLWQDKRSIAYIVHDMAAQVWKNVHCEQFHSDFLWCL